ncbi:Panacea domain-containing protein [Lactobacillus paragasseri]|uniref:Panacea domain-containing protein n=1 Tax=Lactobacillus paragasseri TaxID=2107999 RepID=UPI00217E0A91|nr:type II toxin-antitoxin system antitoxin SocA domain-containing protein [Lactobacillus paragasseri]UWI43310.1 SocA family protein [Lactobacillus paragasseri]UWI44553.1 SocA family protein [Lactobacillus paragasseri]
MSKYSYNQVADWFLAKGNNSISPKKLQKLVYYAYAWTLTLLNDSSDKLSNRLFDDAKFEAWIHGPVIRKLYAEYADFGFNEIYKKVKAPKFTDDVQDVLDQVWNIYGSYTADQLESMTHQEDPWKSARKGLSPLENSRSIISDKDIFDYYIKRVG